MGSARQDAEHALAHPTSPHGSDAVYCELARAYLGLLGKYGERCSQVSRLAAANARLTAEMERLRSGIRDLRQGLLRGLKPGEGTKPEPMTEVCSVVVCLDALAREDGAS